MNNLDLANHTPVYDHLGRIVSLAERELIRLIVEGDPSEPVPELGIIVASPPQETSATDAQTKSPENS